MIRYRLPHEDLPEFYICRWCGATAEAIEDGRKPRYCAKNRRFKNLRNAMLSEASLEDMLIEIGDSLVGIPINKMRTHVIIDDIGGFETPAQRAAVEKWFDRALMDGSSMARISSGRLEVITREMFSFFDDRPPQDMPLPDEPQDPTTWGK